jgi:hypothetical protein
MGHNINDMSDERAVALPVVPVILAGAAAHDAALAGTGD